ncbi:hypothetical protein EG329_003999 [Mollisiaceae sp. DMI_Dod_QoI]|nr:hypothetical protein EG329_003999 [Helotiales sp. DMI_Dod_QoI]
MAPPKRRAAIAGQEKAKAYAVALAEGAPVSPHTLHAGLASQSDPDLRTPSPTPDEQLDRELQARVAASAEKAFQGGAGRVLESPSPVKNDRQQGFGSSGYGNGGRMSTSRSGGMGPGYIGNPNLDSASKPTPNEQVQQMNKRKFEHQRQKSNDGVQEQGKPPTSSKIVKLKLPHGFSPSPPRPVDQQGDTIMANTPAPRAQPSSRAPGQLNSSPPGSQFMTGRQGQHSSPPGSQHASGGRGQVHSSPPQAAGYRSPYQGPRRPQYSPVEAQFPGGRSQVHTSPPILQREAGQLHSSPPEVKLSRARAQSHSSPPQPSTPPRKSQVPYSGPVLATPPGFPPGFNNPQFNPTVQAYPSMTSGTFSSANGQLVYNPPVQPYPTTTLGTFPPQTPEPRFIPPNQGHGGLGLFSSSVPNQQLPQRTFDKSRITMGFPQHEIDRITVPIKKNSEHKSSNKGSSSNQKPAQRNWAEFPPAPSPSTSALTSMVAIAQEQVKARKVELAPNPTTEQLNEMARNVETMKAELARAPIRYLSEEEERRLHNEVNVMQSINSPGNCYGNAQAAALFRNVQVVSQARPNDIGLRFQNMAARALQPVEPLLVRRSIKKPMTKVFLRLEERIESLVAREREIRDQEEEIVQSTGEVVEPELEANLTEAVDREAWEANMNDAWLSAQSQNEARWNFIQKFLFPGAEWNRGSIKIVHIDENAEELRRNKLLAETCNNFHSALRDEKENRAMPVDRQLPASAYQNLALAKIACAKTSPRFSMTSPLFGTWWTKLSEKIEEMDNQGCTFCLFECDFGIYDARVWLPEEAATGYCYECHKSCMEADDVCVLRQEEDVDYDEPENPCKRQRAQPPLKELCEMSGYRKKARSFANNPERQQALQLLYPKSVFDAAVKAGASKNDANPAVAAYGGVVHVPEQSSNNGDDKVGASSMGFRPGPVLSMNGGSGGPDKGLRAATGMPSLPFIANKPPRPSPLAKETEISPIKDTFPNPTCVSSSVDKQRPSTPPRSARNLIPSMSNGAPFVADPSNNTDTAMPLLPFTGETFGAILIPASPASSQQSSFGGSNSGEISPERRPQGRRAVSDGITAMSRARPGVQRSISMIDGMDITLFKAIGFCRGCPWRQVDVLKAKICDGCRYEKFSIVKHRHMEWKLVKNQGPIIEDGEEVMVPRIGKGWLNNLIYHFGRTHIRNDAFLLRSDGWGY